MPGSPPATTRYTQTIEVADQKLRVAIRPGPLSGPPLLLCNGLGASLEVLAPFVEALDGVTTIAFDVPGNGDSPPAKQPMGMAGLARLVMALLDRLGYSTVDVLGVSWGGFLAQELAHQFPTRVRKLVLAATGAGGMVIPGGLSSLTALTNPWRYNHPDHLDSIAPKLFGGVLRKHPELARKYLGVSKPPSTSGYFGQLFAVMGWMSIFWLHRLRQPTLVLAGRDDPLCPPANGRLLAARIPGARLHLVDDGHLFLATSAETIAPLVREFLVGQDTGHPLTGDGHIGGVRPVRSVPKLRRPPAPART